MDDNVWPPKPKVRRRDRPLSDEERQLWQEWTQAVRPLQGPALRSRQQNTQPQPRRRSSPSPIVLVTPSAHPLSRTSPGRKRGKGRAPEAAIDLHGLTIHRAHDRLLRFLELAQVQDLGLVLVITGKGAGGILKRLEPGDRMEGAEPRSGLLRALLPLWLKENQFQALVRGLEQAPAHQGGAGAWLVHLHRKR